MWVRWFVAVCAFTLLCGTPLASARTLVGNLNMPYWLMKSEPDEFSIDDLAAMQQSNASPEAKRLHDDGALFIGGIKTFIIEEKVIIPISE